MLKNSYLVDSPQTIVHRKISNYGSLSVKGLLLISVNIFCRLGCVTVHCILWTIDHGLSTITLLWTVVCRPWTNKLKTNFSP